MHRPIRTILGIETSCDETAAAVVRDGVQVLSNVIASQHALHEEYRGVVPEIASRAHAERILPVLRQALRDAHIALDAVDAVAVGNRPGLIGSLLVGVSAAKALAWTLGIPVIGVDHVHAHLYAPCLDAQPPQLPALGLVVSGGHTSLYLCESLDAPRRLGSTIDDAVGEAFDKVASILDIPYPGGPNLDKLASRGNDTAVELPLSRLAPDSLDFSFSGLKTAVLYAARGVPTRDRPGPPPPPPEPITDARRADLAASFQRAAIDAVILKLKRTLARHQDVRTILVGGGVSANSRLRRELQRLGEQRRIDVRLPRMDLCVDNAAMIAGLAHLLLSQRNGESDPLTMTASPTTRC